ncbi:protein-L-isoaspartate(D-aspartate) O-methyltransferase [Gammaproteobacteria bacterium]|nr:protein-L-isoaspartate(D-aspartate) O-methyltransferase [Gammaproteobacteria bacterium]MDC0545546.1 protein-L-isoaspartate(D-aspartate) O-methyltransferase [Gammaproteobacteria bacterium]MDC0569851.1 protein-L-isoaspartate(D-aspartate) O-methyltransferase [Gammaproteobacteria bacterium]MDC0577392.1 protein-L-isoaspartate(D-aspartate) O-methyltransferase [Gammaproteobacteria bacterium]|tara:strand:+ start:1537 stop:2220 length:684 start_codon:yes stop_codon:yes gene_type:complete
MSLDKELLQGQGMTSLRTRQRLIERLTEKGISDVRVLEAMRDSPRHLFLDEALSTRAYEDLALPIGYQQTISQPYIVARMTEALVSGDRLAEVPLKKTLEIGTGCGYQTYLLAIFSKKVTSIERIEPLQDKAKKTLKQLKVNNVEFMVDDGNKLGDQKYDAILSAAAPLEIPQFLKEKLNVGGKLIIPVGDSNKQILTLIKRTSKDIFIEEKLEEVLFVPLLKGVVS